MALATATIGCVAAAVFTPWTAGVPESASARRTLPGAAAGVVPAAQGQRTGTVKPESPRQARLPSGKLVPIRPVSTTSGGTLAVPGDVNVSGWWRGGSRIGDPFGSTLLAAHVDSPTQGLGPYAELLTVSSKDSIVLTSAHLRQEFSVTSLRLVPRGTLPEHEWIYAPHGARRLTLVTCAGRYVPSKGGYQQLAIVTAVPVGPPTRRGA